MKKITLILAVLFPAFVFAQNKDDLLKWSSKRYYASKSDSQAYDPADDRLLKISQIGRDVEQLKSDVHTIKDILLWGAGIFLGFLAAYVIILLVKIFEPFNWLVRLFASPPDSK